MAWQWKMVSMLGAGTRISDCLAWTLPCSQHSHLPWGISLPSGWTTPSSLPLQSSHGAALKRSPAKLVPLDSWTNQAKTWGGGVTSTAATRLLSTPWLSPVPLGPAYYPDWASYRPINSVSHDTLPVNSPFYLRWSQLVSEDWNQDL